MANTHSLDLELSSSQYATASDSASLSPTGDITIEAWLKVETLPSVSGSTYTICNKGNWTSGSTRSWYMFMNTSDVIQFILSGDGSLSNILTITQTASAFSAGVWTHLAVSVDVSTDTGVVYINGSSVSSTSVQTGTFSGIFDSSDSFYLGARNNSGSPQNFYDGLIDDVRLWSDIRTSGEIAANYTKELVGNEANLNAYWKLNNAATDSTANGNTLTLQNSPVYSTDVPFVGATNAQIIFM